VQDTPVSPEPNANLQSVTPNNIAPVGSALPERPRWLSIIAIASIVIGASFGCCNLLGLGSLAASKTTSSFMMKMADGSPQAKAQRTAMMRAQKLQERVMPLTLTAQITSLLHKLALLIAGVFAYRAHGFGRRLLLAMCLAGVLVETVDAWVGLYVAGEQAQMQESLMKDLFSQQAQQARQHTAPGKPQPPQIDAKQMSGMFGGFMRIAMWIMIGGMALMKIVFYGISVLYLRNRDVVVFFDAADQAHAAA
jgi:hypothetical protein